MAGASTLPGPPGPPEVPGVGVDDGNDEEDELDEDEEAFPSSIIEHSAVCSGDTGTEAMGEGFGS